MTQKTWQAAALESARIEHKALIADAKAMADHWRDEAKKLERDLGVALALKKHAQKKPVAITQGRKHDSESVAVAIASDWHCSELVEPETVNGRNEFSLAIADNRIKQFFRKTLALTETHSGKSKGKSNVNAMHVQTSRSISLYASKRRFNGIGTSTRNASGAS